MIRELTIPNQNQSLIAQTWSNIPDFSVIAGLNGAGKSQLLAAINLSIQHAKSKRTVALVQIAHASQLTGKIKYVPAGFTPSNIDKEPNKTVSRLEARRANLIKMIRAKEKPNLSNIALVNQIKTTLGSSIDELSDAELLDSFPTDLRLRMEDCFNNDYIAEVFKDYQERVSQFKLKNFHVSGPRPSEEEIHTEIGATPPWPLSIMNLSIPTPNFDR